MIVKISARGTSFSGLATYLTHDPKEKTDERVGWTHTLNCANDHVPSAVDEMYRTAQNAELLKQEAGIRAGGREAEKTVLHASLNWAPDESPTRDHMIETAESFLKHMGWQERQALLVAHTDKEYAHVHLMVNAINPETGLCLDDSFEQRRAQDWALSYERENNRIYCEERLKNIGERADNPTRPAWRAFKDKEIEFSNTEKLLRENNFDLSENRINPENIHDAEWKRLKEIQRQERVDFFAEGKSEFNDLRKSIYREVREEFRERWADLYAAQKDGADITDLKAALIADQTNVLEKRRDEACNELRETRDAIYRDLLDSQRESREALRARQEMGFENGLFFEKLADGKNKELITDRFEEAARDFGERQDGVRDMGHASDEGFSHRQPRDNTRMKTATDAAANIADGLGFGLISLFESVADGFIGAKQEPKPRAPEPDPPGPDLFDIAANEARKAQQQRDQQDDADEEWRKKQRSYGE